MPITIGFSNTSSKTERTVGVLLCFVIVVIFSTFALIKGLRFFYGIRYCDDDLWMGSWANFGGVAIFFMSVFYYISIKTDEKSTSYCTKTFSAVIYLGWILLGGVWSIMHKKRAGHCVPWTYPMVRTAIGVHAILFFVIWAVLTVKACRQMAHYKRNRGTVEVRLCGTSS